MLPGAEEYLAAFWELSNDRAIGFSVGPIPSLAIEFWAVRRGMDDDELLLFRGAIRAMDRVFMESVLDKVERVDGKPKPRVIDTPVTSVLFDSMFPGN